MQAAKFFHKVNKYVFGCKVIAFPSKLITTKVKSCKWAILFLPLHPIFGKYTNSKTVYFMIIILSLLFGSIAIGCICKNIKALKALSDKVSITILLLLLTLGLSVGSQDSVTGNLLHLGFIALAIAVACVAGSVLLTFGISRLAERRRK